MPRGDKSGHGRLSRDRVLNTGLPKINLGQVVLFALYEKLLNTRVLEISEILGAEHKIFVLPEYLNPSGSIKDRVVLQILKKAFESGKVRPGTMVVEVTSGNTGIALAYWSNIFGLRAKIFMPAGISMERRKMMELLGTEVIETPGNFEEARRMAKSYARAAGAFYLGQFEREENLGAYRTIGEKLLGYPVEYFIAGVGTGGTLMGFARILKKKGVKTVGVFPGEKQHGIQ